MSLFDAYVSGQARALFEAHYAAEDDRRRIVARVVRPIDSRVADALELQNQSWAADPARDANLAILRRGAAAVVTGQQVGLYLGPLFTIYKAATAIRWARALADETGVPVVPVFWLQTEDHDLPEIATTSLPSATISVSARAGEDEHLAIASRRLPDEISSANIRLRELIGNLEHGAEHLARIDRFYRPGARWSDAFAGVMAELFSGTGLVFCDPRDRSLASAAAPMHLRALERSAAIDACLLDRCSRLASSGHQPQVHVRAGSPLFFVHGNGAEGPRARLEATAEGYRSLGGEQRWTRATLIDLLKRDPLCFSTSALLRPILQDTIFPTAAYVGGPGEIAYFAQLAPLYREMEVTMPLIVPRMRARIIDAKTKRLLERLDLRADEISKSEDLLLARIAANEGASATPDVGAKLLAAFDDALRAVMIEGGALGLEVPAKKTRATVESAVAQFAKKYETARLHRNERQVEDVRRLQGILFPQNAPQERVFGPSYFFARFGERNLVDRVLAAVRPHDANIVELEL